MSSRGRAASETRSAAIRARCSRMFSTRKFRRPTPNASMASQSTPIPASTPPGPSLRERAIRPSSFTRLLFQGRRRYPLPELCYVIGCRILSPDGHKGKRIFLLKDKRWRKKYVSLNLVYSYWANLGRYREIGDARAHGDLLDDRARRHRIDPWRWRYPHVFAPDKRTISSRRPHFIHTGRDPGSLHLL